MLHTTDALMIHCDPPDSINYLRSMINGHPTLRGVILLHLSLKSGIIYSFQHWHMPLYHFFFKTKKIQAGDHSTLI